MKLFRDRFAKIIINIFGSLLSRNACINLFFAETAVSIILVFRLAAGTVRFSFSLLLLKYSLSEYPVAGGRFGK